MRIAPPLVWLVLAALLLQGRLDACDPILLDLLRGQTRQSVFDDAIERISTRLQNLAGYARFGRWVEAGRLASELQRDWVGVYASFYLSEPAQASDSSLWQETFDRVSAELGAIDGWLQKRDFEAAHPSIRSIQDRLIGFYRERAPSTPAARFERARKFVRSLRELAEAGAASSLDIGSAYVHVADEIRRLPVVDGPRRDTMMQAIRAVRSELQAPEALRRASAELETALERYRESTLEGLWFGPGKLERKEGTP